ncbi:hypothetical protein D4764_21G0002410 [Takifugu flavidus]|uniref:Reverse transcriptase domain-containing protein n=1 Tax=Takifugu flavidus TaxID=433684 RepID=A0A5C6NFH5_9TELE|nr:hypothetical protein D4764_21G0002410 [Takifugu flavidus]
MGPPSCGLTTCRRGQGGRVHCVLGSSRRQGPWQSDPRLHKLALGTWNVTSLVGNEPELVCEVEKFRLDIVGLTSMHSKGSGTSLLERGWTLYHSGIADGERRRAGVAILVATQLSACILESYRALLACGTPEAADGAVVVDSTLQHRVDIGGSAAGLADRGGSPSFKKGDRRVCSNYRGITLLSLPVDQLYTLSRVFEGAWEFAQPVHVCFVDLEKAFDRVPRGVLWGVLREYGVSGPLIRAVRSLYDRCQSLVRIAGNLTEMYHLAFLGFQEGLVSQYVPAVQLYQGARENLVIRLFLEVRDDLETLPSPLASMDINLFGANFMSLTSFPGGPGSPGDPGIPSAPGLPLSPRGPDGPIIGCASLEWYPPPPGGPGRPLSPGEPFWPGSPGSP